MSNQAQGQIDRGVEVQDHRHERFAGPRASGETNADPDVAVVLLDAHDAADRVVENL